MILFGFVVHCISSHGLMRFELSHCSNGVPLTKYLPVLYFLFLFWIPVLMDVSNDVFECRLNFSCLISGYRF